MGKEFVELFYKFKPSYIFMDADSGRFNRDFLPTKDTYLGLTTLFSTPKENN